MFLSKICTICKPLGSDNIKNPSPQKMYSYFRTMAKVPFKILTALNNKLEATVEFLAHITGSQSRKVYLVVRVSWWGEHWGVRAWRRRVVRGHCGRRSDGPRRPDISEHVDVAVGQGTVSDIVLNLPGTKSSNYCDIKKTRHRPQFWMAELFLS